MIARYDLFTSLHPASSAGRVAPVRSASPLPERHQSPGQTASDFWCAFAAAGLKAATAIKCSSTFPARGTWSASGHVPDRRAAPQPVYVQMLPPPTPRAKKALPGEMSGKVSPPSLTHPRLTVCRHYDPYDLTPLNQTTEFLPFTHHSLCAVLDFGLLNTPQSLRFQLEWLHVATGRRLCLQVQGSLAAPAAIPRRFLAALSEEYITLAEAYGRWSLIASADRSFVVTATFLAARTPSIFPMRKGTTD